MTLGSMYQEKALLRKKVPFKKRDGESCWWPKGWTGDPQPIESPGFQLFFCFIYPASSSYPYGGFLKWWYPTTMGFPTKNDHFRVFGGYHHLRKHPYIWNHAIHGTGIYGFGLVFQIDDSHPFTSRMWKNHNPIPSMGRTVYVPIWMVDF